MIFGILRKGEKMGRVFCCSDLHGADDLYYEILNYIRPDDKVFCLGDCGDRGKRSWKLIKEVYNNPQFVYLKGNHEEMLVKAGREFINSNYVTGKHYQNLKWNGGADTFAAWSCASSKEEWLDKLEKLPTFTVYLNTDGKFVLLSHAGYTPTRDCPKPTEYKAIWDRAHFFDTWNFYDNVVCVHGHTPVQFLYKELQLPKTNMPITYCDGHKIDIDLGTYASHLAALLNLDTFETKVFHS
jgi:calcineurin-like phosphoesterase family protein